MEGSEEKRACWMRGHERFQHDGACAGLPGGGGVSGEGWLSVMKNLRSQAPQGEGGMNHGVSECLRQE